MASGLHAIICHVTSKNNFGGIWSVGWLVVGWSTQKGQCVPSAGGGKPAQSAKDGQRGRPTMHINLRIYTR